MLGASRGTERQTTESSMARAAVATPVTSPYGAAAAAAIEKLRPTPQQPANPSSDSFCELMFDQMMELWPMAKKERYRDRFGSWSVQELETDFELIKSYRIWTRKHVQRSHQLATGGKIRAVGPQSPSHTPPRECTSTGRSPTQRPRSRQSVHPPRKKHPN